MTRTAVRTAHRRADLSVHLPALRAALEQQRRFRIDQITELLADTAARSDAALDPRDEVARALYAGASAALLDIENALRRIATGSYGRCQRCAAAVALERLEILPSAPLCMTCQRAAELKVR